MSVLYICPHFQTAIGKIHYTYLIIHLNMRTANNNDIAVRNYVEIICRTIITRKLLEK